MKNVLNVESQYGGVMVANKLSSYQKLKKKIDLLEKDLYMNQLQIKDAHEMCDKLDVPRNKLGAFVGHRLLWYSEGKRERFKTKKNMDGYPPEEHERNIRMLEEVRTPPVKKENKKRYQHNLNALGDES